MEVSCWLELWTDFQNISKYFRIFPELQLTVSSSLLGSLGMFRATTLGTRYFKARTTVSQSDTFLQTSFICLTSGHPDNCIRQEKGYCRIQWQESASTTPDPFAMDTVTTGSGTAAGGTTPAIAIVCNLAQVTIPDGSPNGVNALDSTTPAVVSLSAMAYQSEWCGSNLGYTNLAVSMSVTCKSLSISDMLYYIIKQCDTNSCPNAVLIHLTSAARQPFNLGVWTAPGTDLGSGGTGFNLDYTQVLYIKRN